MVRSLAPLLAPVFGAAIIHFFPWEGVFIFLTIYALIVTFFIYKDLPESFTKTKQKIIEYGQKEGNNQPDRYIFRIQRTEEY